MLRIVNLLIKKEGGRGPDYIRGYGPLFARVLAII